MGLPGLIEYNRLDQKLLNYPYENITENLQPKTYNNSTVTC